MLPASTLVSVSKMSPQHFPGFLTTGHGKTGVNVSERESIFRQGGPADCIFYIQNGRVKISVTSSHVKEAYSCLAWRG